MHGFLDHRVLWRLSSRYEPALGSGIEHLIRLRRASEALKVDLSRALSTVTMVWLMVCKGAEISRFMAWKLDDKEV